MDEGFELPVIYKGKELMLPASLHRYGYVHRFEVLVDETPVYFEKDEEGNYRALVDSDSQPGKIDRDLYEAIAQAIETVLR